MLSLFGGSFDPPHMGHIKGVINAAKEIHTKSVAFMPCAQSPLKSKTMASDVQRLKMLQLACQFANQQQSAIQLTIDETELSLPTPSYTVNTLRQIRRKLGNEISVCFFLGEDSLYTLNKWKDWQSLMSLCHLVVMRRETAPKTRSQYDVTWLKQHLCEQQEILAQAPYGKIYMCDTPLVTVSSSYLRQQLRTDVTHAKPWFSESLYEYITSQNIYFSDKESHCK